MRFSISSLACTAALAAMFAPAVTSQVVIPAHNNVYNGYSRGFNFTANVDFFINKLDLPLDAFQAGDTAGYYIRVNGVEIYRSAGNAGAVSVTPIQIKTGDVVDVIGNWSPIATSNFSAHNSYGSGAPFATTILGVAHTLNRTGMQHDVGDPAYAGKSILNPGSGSIGRVFMHVTPPAGLFAGFSATPTNGVSPMAVQFTDSTFTSDPAGIASWGWDFDANGIIDSTVQNPNFTYFGGVWDVSLMVTDTMHPASTELKTGYINVDAVVAAFTATNTNGASPLAVVFADASTGPITLHEWDFNNDGTVDSNVQNPTFTYVLGGKYTVALGVSNATSASVDTQADLVVVDEIVASFTASAYAVAPGSNVVFTDTSTGPVGAWTWDFDNDGIVDSVIQNPNFTYAQPGIFPVTMVAMNAFFTETATATIEVGTIPMPPFTRTYSYISNARGYWFVTPVPFTITGLQAPDETAHGLQNVAVARVQGTASTATYDFLGEANGVPSSQVVPMSASFAAGDTVYVLGACGDATNMHNSYATGGPTTVLGNPISLLRAYYQANLVTAPLSAGGNTLYISTSTTIARVFTAISDAAGIDYGAGSDNGLGNGAPTMTTTALPVLGANATLEVTNTDAGSVSGAILVGFGRTPLPTPLGTVNVSTIVMDIPVTAFTGAGTFPTTIAIPNTPSILGGPTNFQSVILNPAAPSFFGMTNGVEWFIGSY